MMDEISEALTEAGYVVFFAAGVGIDDKGMPRMRAGADANIVRKLSESSWAIMRETLIRELDMLRSAPLDDLTRP